MDKRTNKHTEWQLHFLSCLSQLEMSSRGDNRDRKVPVPRIQFLNSRDVPRNQKKNSRDDIKDNKVPVPRIQFWISRDSHPWFILGTSLELNFLTLGTSLEWIRDGYHNLKYLISDTCNIILVLWYLLSDACYNLLLLAKTWFLSLL